MLMIFHTLINISCRTFVRNERLKACPGLICKGCQEGGQRLDEYETFGVLSVHSWIKTSQGLSKRSSAKRVWELFKYSRNQLRTKASHGNIWFVICISVLFCTELRANCLLLYK